MSVAAKDARLNLRLTPTDDTLIRRAAESAGQSVTEFLTIAAVDRARSLLADQREFVVDDVTWDAFVEILDRPPRPHPRLVELFATPSRISR